MAKDVLRIGTGIAMLVAGTCTVTGTAWAGPSGPANQAVTVGSAAVGNQAVGAAVVRQAHRGEVCRQAAVRPAPGLVAQARVCLRYVNGSWVGSGELVLKAARLVSGAFSWGPRYYPVRPSVFVGGENFTLKAGETVTYPLPGTATADPADTGADWEVWMGVPNGNRAVGLEASVTSPVATRRAAFDQASHFSGRTPWTCSAKRVSGQTLSGVATLCMRQVKGQLESKAFLTYRSAITVDLSVGLAVDGVAGTTSTTVPVKASPNVRWTVTLPTSTAQARKQDHRAATFLLLGPAPVLSAAVTVR